MISNQDNFHPNGTSIILQKNQRLLEGFLMLFSHHFSPSCLHSPSMSLIHLSYSTERIYRPQKGSGPLSSHRKRSTLHLSRLKGYLLEAAESQLDAMQEAKETPQEERHKIFSKELSTWRISKKDNSHFIVLKATLMQHVQVRYFGSTAANGIIKKQS